MEYPRMSEYVADVVDDGIASIEILSAREVMVVFCLERKGGVVHLLKKEEHERGGLYKDDRQANLYDWGRMASPKIID